MLRRVHPHADGAHDRNRTGDLLLTMEMLYRLSYVGAHDRDHPSGQRGSDAERKERWTGRCGRAGSARVCEEKTHHPEGDLLVRRPSWGVARIRESRPRSPRRQRETSEKSRLAAPAGIHSSRCDDHAGATRNSFRTQNSPDGVWSGKRDSNPRPSAWKADALAAELFPRNALR